MRPAERVAISSGGAAAAPGATAGRPWPDTLRALRAARGATQEGWAARLGVSRKTVQRWEGGARAPDAGAEAAIVAYCHEAGLLRAFGRGPLAGLTLTEEGLRDLIAEARWRDPGTVAAAPATPTNLPAPLTGLVGRRRALAAVRRVQAGARLLTLTGTGGAGKTRLALALAEELRRADAYPHGVWFVDLAPLSDPALVPAAVATALGVRPVGQRPPAAALVDALRPRQLLVLDNCEHLRPACAALVETLLGACPLLEVVATSREPLGVGGEVTWRVPPLAVPPAHAQRPGEVGRYEAARLFVDRARAARPDFVLDDRTAPAVAEVCRRLDGLPLAIELAAARVRMLTAAQIGQHLDDRFRLLSGGCRTAPPRRRTLRATLDWSHDLLSAPERALFRRLAVFAGGWTLEAAEAVGAGRGAPAETVLDLLTRLVDRSLVEVDAAPVVARYRLLETVREYARERLAAGGEADAVRRRHARHFLALAEAAAPALTGGERGRWLQRLAADHDNLRAALSWCWAETAPPGRRATGARLAAALEWFWSLRGHLSEGRDWLERAAAAAPAGRETRASAAHGAGTLAWLQGDYGAARAHLEASLAVWRARGDARRAAFALHGLGVIAFRQGDADGAQARHAESAALFRARADRSGTAWALNALGHLALERGDVAGAERCLEESLGLYRALGDAWGMAWSHGLLGEVAAARGDLSGARARYAAGLAGLRESGDRWGLSVLLDATAALAAARAQPGRALRLAGAAAALRAAIGLTRSPADDARAERRLRAARAALGGAAAAAAWAAGRAMSLEAATACALEDGGEDVA